MGFFVSELGASIAWFCTVIGFFYSLFKREEVKKLKIKIQQIDQSQTSVDISRDKKEIKNKDVLAEQIDQSSGEVTQTGEKNIYAKQVTGGMKINM